MTATSAHMISRQMNEANQHDADRAGFEAARPFWVTAFSRLTSRLRAMFNLPPAALSRVTVVFFALALIKIALLVKSGKQLHEIHWRVGGYALGWSGYAVFFGVVGLGVWSLIE